MNVCTIVAKNYLAHARLLARSLTAQHPDSRLTVLVLDDIEGYVDPADEPYRLWGPQDIDCDPFAEMASKYSVIELSTAVKPWLLQTLLADADHAVYLDPDIQVLAPLDEVRELAVEHGIVLTPHNLTPIPRDGLYPSEESILIAGAYNLGFIALGRSTAADELLAWWAERLETDCVVDPASGRFVDQKWIDLVPGLWPSTRLLRDPTYNIAYWNLHDRHLERDGEGNLTLAGRPVRFLHFSGYDPHIPEELSKHQNRIRLDERPDVRAACDAYGQALLREGFDETSTWPYGLAGRSRAAGHGSRGAPGANVVGYLNAELGVGEVARQAIGALEAQGVPVLPVGVSSGVNRENHLFDRLENPGHGPFAVNVICVNADMLPTVVGDLGPEFFEGRPTAGWWWWEVDSFPERFHGSFELVDEVWAGSRFVADTLATSAPVPVVHIPTPVTMRQDVQADRAAVGLPGGFVFLFVFDFNSVMARKNPLGLVEAFRRAFPEGRDGVSLVLKTINGERHPESLAVLRDAAAERDDIVVIDGYLDAHLKDVLIASCDCYVSLHRSEGFGITLAEAMLLGRPVIGTGYSGPEDYLSEETGYPVRYQMVPIGGGQSPYPVDGQWAEPDAEHAAELMRHVVDDPDESQRRAARGQTYMRTHHSAVAAGKVMSGRLARLTQAAGADAHPTIVAQQARTDTLGLVRGGPAPAVSMRGKLADRVVAPLTRRARVEQRTIDEALWWSVETHAVATGDALAELDRRLSRVEGQGDHLSRAQQQQSRHVSAIEKEMPHLHELWGAAAAEPYMEGTPFDRFDTPDAGRVLGYRGGEDDVPADGDYHAFEDVFRGSEELIRQRQQRYVALLRESVPVVDVGCGRGELLDVLRDAGVDARGVDLDPELVAYCRGKGHGAVEQGDAVGYLESLDPGAIGAVCAMQVVEHLDGHDLERLLKEARRVLQADGRLILETVNPHSPWALKAFWVDLTHVQPIFPEVLLQLCRQAGFREAFAFIPTGAGDWDEDRTRFGEYAVVATR